jgi:hypothetical protein
MLKINMVGRWKNEKQTQNERGKEKIDIQVKNESKYSEKLIIQVSERKNNIRR